MLKSISDQKLNRHISKLLKHLPDQAELNGERQEGNFYRYTNDKSFVDAHRLAYKQVTGLMDKFQLTTEQKKHINTTQKGLIQRVETAFDDWNNTPANFDTFVQQRKKSL